MEGNQLFQSKVNHFYKGEPINLLDLVQVVVERFLSIPLAERLEKLSTLLESKDQSLAELIRRIETEVKKDDWGMFTSEDGISSIPTVGFYVDAHIEANLPATIRMILYQMMIEGLVGADCTPVKYQEHMRHAAGLGKEMSANTEKFLARLHRRLIVDERKNWMDIKRGGSKSPLKIYSHALCFHYERTRPILAHAKKVYKNQGGGKAGREAVKREYEKLGEGARWAIKLEYVGIPDKLISGLEFSSPEDLAYEWAAFLCGFDIGSSQKKKDKRVYSLKEIERVIKEHKRMMGPEYYNQTFKA